MTATQDRIYQTSDLSGAARREFLEAGLNGCAHLRTPDGDSLVLTRTAHLNLLSDLRDHLMSYLMLDSALARPRVDRRASDYGTWAFVSVFEDEGIEEFRDEVNDAIVRAVSGEDASIVDNLLREWRRSASAYENPITRAAILGQLDPEDFVEVSEPQAGDPSEG